MVGEDILQGIEDVDSEIVAVVDTVNAVGVVSVDEVGVEIAVFDAAADTVEVAVDYEVANVVGEGYIDYVEVVVAQTDTVEVAVDYEVANVVGEGYIDYVEVVVAQTGAETGPAGSVDDAVVQIHNVYVEMRVGLGD